MPTILVVGATRGLGASIAEVYAADADNHVLATARSSDPPAGGMCIPLSVWIKLTKDLFRSQERCLHPKHRHLNTGGQ